MNKFTREWWEIELIAKKYLILIFDDYPKPIFLLFRFDNHQILLNEQFD